AVVGLVLHVSDRDRDAALALLRGLVDLVERRELRQTLVGLTLGDRGRERGLAVVDMAHRADVHVGLRALELLLRHAFLRGASRASDGRSVAAGGIEPPTQRL